MSGNRWTMWMLLLLLLPVVTATEAVAEDEGASTSPEVAEPAPTASGEAASAEPAPAFDEIAEALQQVRDAAAVAEAARAEAARLLDEAKALHAATAAAATEDPTDAPLPAEPAPAGPPPARATLFTLPGDVPFSIDLSGKYALWVLNQHGFLLGQDHPLDDADYVVQMLRLKLKVGTPYFGAVARLDAGQGWWGVDNSPDVQTGLATSGDGTVNAIASYNTYKLFGNKDTNYTVHFDHVYAYITPPLPVEWTVTIGRQNYSLGHKLVLDEDYDGVKTTFRPKPFLGFEAFFAVVSEGLGSYKAPTGLLMSDDDPYGDALLVGGSVDAKLGPMTVGVFGAHYWDRTAGQDTTSHLPAGVGYLRSRFRPNLSVLTALGLTVDGTLPLLGGLSIAAEGDVLFGADKIDNADHAGALLDMNDGTVTGWNAYLEVDQAIPVGPVVLTPGLTVGVGSGDDDVTSGRGNTNQIATMGFFPLTNVWEDSVMPDISGISPQGLGSPVSRGYREFENTIALQGRLGFVPWKPLDLTVTYTFLRATQPIVGWDDTGAPTEDSSRDIGHEIDVNLAVKILPRVTWTALFGAFLPREGASLLITGTPDNTETAWELKQVVGVGF